MTHYEHSGRAPATAWAAALGGGGAAGLALGAAYAFAIAYIPFVGKITFVLAAGFGALAGALTAYLFRKGGGRSTLFGTFAGLQALVPAFYMAWVTWCFAVLNRGDGDASFAALLAPDALWEAVARINEQGAWSLRGGTPTGNTLWGLWSVEALLIFGSGTLAAAAVASEGVYCERCGTWCVERQGALLSNPAPEEHVKPRVDAHDWSVLQQLGPTAPGAQKFLRWDLSSCPKCQQTHTLSVHEVAQNGQNTESKPFVSHLLVSPDEARWLGTLQPAGPPV